MSTSYFNYNFYLPTELFTNSNFLSYRVTVKCSESEAESLQIFFLIFIRKILNFGLEQVSTRMRFFSFFIDLIFFQ